MAFARRWPLFAALAVISLFLLYQLHTNRAPTLLPSEPQTYQPPPKDDDRFHWIDVPTRYPVSSFTPLPSRQPLKLPLVQHNFPQETVVDRATRLERQQQIKKSFERCWKSYKELAWMKDELSPISGSGRDAFGGWAATMVDALDTLHIMGMDEELDFAIEAVNRIDFTTSTESTINVFETTIRYLGGFLAAYDLTGKKVLLDKAAEIGEMLFVAFDTPNHMPVTRWDWARAAKGDAQEA